MFDDVGLLDERFFMYDDDIDLSFRAQLRGYHCIFVPQALVYHKVSGTAGLGSDRAIYWSKRNSTWVVLKNIPFGLLIALSWLIVPYALFSDCRWILSGRVRPVVRGRLDALRALPAVLRERAQIQRQRRVSNKELLALLTPGVPQLPSLVRSSNTERTADAKVT
jgi:GT2 family glycosyltransferase